MKKGLKFKSDQYLQYQEEKVRVYKKCLFLTTYKI